MSSRKFVDWRTVNLDEFTNVVFKDAPTKGSKSAVIKNSKGDFLQFISPTLRTFGIGEMENDGKYSWSISQSLDPDAKDAAEYQAFLDRLTVHMGKFASTGRKPEPLAQYPKVKDPNKPNSFIEISENVFARDKTRSATVRYKIYPERENGMETGSLGVKIYGKGNVPLFDYNDADSRAAFKDTPAPERNWGEEKAAVGPGSRVQILCTARMASTSYGAVFYGTLAATQIKRVTAGGEGGGDRNAPAFDLDEEDDEPEQHDGEATRMAAPPATTARRAAQQQQQHEDDGVDDELEVQVHAPTVGRRRHEEEEAPPVVAVAPKKKLVAAAAVAEEDADEAPAPVIVAAPIKKPRKLVVPAAVAK